jgi:hypothetical protein
MCPVCLMTVAMIAAGTGTAGSLTAVVAKKIYDIRASKPNETETPKKESQTKDQLK